MRSVRLLLVVALMAVAGNADAQGGRGPGGRMMGLSANPSAVIAAEIGFSQLAREKGQWTAFRETAAKEAVMFVPEQVVAQTWLKGRKDPASPMKWQPHAVYMSCDGGVAASTGSWQRPDGSQGYFTSIWRRDPKKGWHWVLDHGDTLSVSRAEPEMITGKVAACPPRRPRPLMGEDAGSPAAGRPGKPGKPEKPAPFLPSGSGASADGTLSWSMTVAPDLSRRFVVHMRQEGGDSVVIDDQVKAPAA
ncbi:MAG: hypothetical protein DI547_08205 [Sphingobium sp.]|jgi:hypothetical protein|nr:MAG: hypothetical protein DI547_08205 [Sphingobium sp.]